MVKYKVLLHGSDVLLREEEGGEPQLAGFYVNCCVEASDKESAGNMALDELRRNGKYLGLEVWPGSGRTGPPPIAVDSVDRVPFWRRRLALGITTGFVFYVDTEKQRAPTKAAEG